MSMVRVTGISFKPVQLRSPANRMNGPDNLRPVPQRVQSATEEMANSVSHGFGLIAALVGAPVLLLAASHTTDARFFAGSVVFIITTLAVYLGSTLYHAWPDTPRKSALQLFDHSAIFLLIAGTYTPFALSRLDGAYGPAMFGLVWAIAVLGIILKVVRGATRHPKIAMCLYLGMGWSGLLVLQPLSVAVPPAALIWLVAGGVIYTTGVLFFINERIRYAHFVWHLFVIGGSTCHFFALLACTG